MNMAAFDSIGRKVGTVNSEYFSHVQLLSGNNQGCISEVHARVRVLNHQLESATACDIIEKQNRKPAPAMKSIRRRERGFPAGNPDPTNVTP